MKQKKRHNQQNIGKESMNATKQKKNTDNFFEKPQLSNLQEKKDGL